MPPDLPEPRGPLSAELIEYLRGSGRAPAPITMVTADPLADEDLQLSLYAGYELHYRGFAGVGDGREWDPALIELRGALERVFLGALSEAVPRRDGLAPDDVGPLLFELAAAYDGPDLSGHLGRSGTLEQFREFAIHRSAYQLKEADPHSLAVACLDGPAKAAMMEVQFDEYGSGKPERMHSRLFADAMDALGLDSSYGHYLDSIPGHTLATVNLMTMLALQRRWRGAIVGHLAMFEITSAGPNRSYANGLRRLGVDEATGFFDEHVEADSVHENIAAHDLAGGLAEQEPGLAGDILFGAECLLEIESRWAARLLEAWDRGESSLLPEPAAAAA